MKTDKFVSCVPDNLRRRKRRRRRRRRRKEERGEECRREGEKLDAGGVRRGEWEVKRIEKEEYGEEQEDEEEGEEEEGYTEEFRVVGCLLGVVWAAYKGNKVVTMSFFPSSLLHFIASYALLFSFAIYLYL